MKKTEQDTLKYSYDKLVKYYLYLFSTEMNPRIIKMSTKRKAIVDTLEGIQKQNVSQHHVEVKQKKGNKNTGDRPLLITTRLETRKKKVDLLEKKVEKINKLREQKIASLQKESYPVLFDCIEFILYRNDSDNTHHFLFLKMDGKNQPEGYVADNVGGKYKILEGETDKNDEMAAAGFNKFIKIIIKKDNKKSNVEETFTFYYNQQDGKIPNHYFLKLGMNNLFKTIFWKPLNESIDERKISWFNGKEIYENYRLIQQEDVLSYKKLEMGIYNIREVSLLVCKNEENEVMPIDIQNDEENGKVSLAFHKDEDEYEELLYVHNLLGLEDITKIPTKVVDLERKNKKELLKDVYGKIMELIKDKNEKKNEEQLKEPIKPKENEEKQSDYNKIIDEDDEDEEEGKDKQKIPTEEDKKRLEKKRQFKLKELEKDQNKVIIFDCKSFILYRENYEDKDEGESVRLVCLYWNESYVRPDYVTLDEMKKIGKEAKFETGYVKESRVWFDIFSSYFSHFCRIITKRYMIKIYYNQSGGLFLDPIMVKINGTYEDILGKSFKEFFGEEENITWMTDIDELSEKILRLSKKGAKAQLLNENYIKSVFGKNDYDFGIYKKRELNFLVCRNIKSGEIKVVSKYNEIKENIEGGVPKDKLKKENKEPENLTKFKVNVYDENEKKETDNEYNVDFYGLKENATRKTLIHTCIGEFNHDLNILLNKASSKEEDAVDKKRRLVIRKLKRELNKRVIFDCRSFIFGMDKLANYFCLFWNGDTENPDYIANGSGNDKFNGANKTQISVYKDLLEYNCEIKKRIKNSDIDDELNLFYSGKEEEGQTNYLVSIMGSFVNLFGTDINKFIDKTKIYWLDRKEYEMNVVNLEGDDQRKKFQIGDKLQIGVYKQKGYNFLVVREQDDDEIMLLTEIYENTGKNHIDHIEFKIMFNDKEGKEETLRFKLDGFNKKAYYATSLSKDENLKGYLEAIKKLLEYQPKKYIENENKINEENEENLNVKLRKIREKAVKKLVNNGNKIIFEGNWLIFYMNEASKKCNFYVLSEKDGKPVYELYDKNINYPGKYKITHNREQVDIYEDLVQEYYCVYKYQEDKYGPTNKIKFNFIKDEKDNKPFNCIFEIIDGDTKFEDVYGFSFDEFIKNDKDNVLWLKDIDDYSNYGLYLFSEKEKKVKEVEIGVYKKDGTKFIVYKKDGEPNNIGLVKKLVKTGASFSNY